MDQDAALEAYVERLAAGWAAAPGVAIPRSYLRSRC